MCMVWFHSSLTANRYKAFLTDHLYYMLKHFHPDYRSYCYDNSTPSIGCEILLNGLMRMEMFTVTRSQSI